MAAIPRIEHHCFVCEKECAVSRYSTIENTCSACRLFFSRCTYRPRCSSGGNCSSHYEIPTRLVCRSCKFRKCEQAGLENAITRVTPPSPPRSVSPPPPQFDFTIDSVAIALDTALFVGGTSENRRYREIVAQATDFLMGENDMNALEKFRLAEKHQMIEVQIAVLRRFTLRECRQISPALIQKLDKRVVADLLIKERQLVIEEEEAPALL